MDILRTYAYIAGCAITFCGLNKYIGYLTVNNYFLVENKKQYWIWTNTFCSFVHSLCSSLWVISSYILEPNLLNDMVDTSSHSASLLVAFSTGYFIYDLIDIYLHDKFRPWELFCHHAVVILAFSICLISNRYIGFALCSLIMEFNSIFLHSRRLMKLSGLTASPLYCVNSALLLITLVFFRICMSAWMIRWLLSNQSQIPFFPFLVGISGMIWMTLTNISLMYRIWSSEYSRKIIEDKVLSDMQK